MGGENGSKNCYCKKFGLWTLLSLKTQWGLGEGGRSATIIANPKNQGMHTAMKSTVKKSRCLYWHLREMLWLIHLFQLYASQINKTILANGIVRVMKIVLCCFPRVTLPMVLLEIPENFGNSITKT